MDDNCGRICWVRLTLACGVGSNGNSAGEVPRLSLSWYPWFSAGNKAGFNYKLTRDAVEMRQNAFIAGRIAVLVSKSMLLAGRVAFLS